MIAYEELLDQLKNQAEPEYARFHKRLLKNDNINVLGVRVPTMRKIAKRYASSVPELMTFPDGYYEVAFVKLQAVALLPWEEFIKYVNDCVALIDNWATCDSFAPKCIATHRDGFLPYVYAYLNDGGEFTQRFALTTLLHFYVEEKYLQVIFDAVSNRADLSLYYVSMASAWLIAEALVKHFDDGVRFLREGALDKDTHNRAIQKACESFRLTKEQKDLLKGLKRNGNR